MIERPFRQGSRPAVFPPNKLYTNSLKQKRHDGRMSGHNKQSLNKLKSEPEAKRL
jgi:hypothetical protein